MDVLQSTILEIYIVILRYKKSWNILHLSTIVEKFYMVLHLNRILTAICDIYTSRNFQWSYTYKSKHQNHRAIYTSRNFLWSYTLVLLVTKFYSIYTSRNFQWSYTTTEELIQAFPIYTSRNFQWSYTQPSLAPHRPVIYTSRNFQWSYTICMQSYCFWVN